MRNGRLIGNSSDWLRLATATAAAAADDNDDDDEELDDAAASAAAELYSLVYIFDAVADDEDEEEEDPISSLVSIEKKFDKCGLFKEREAISPSSSTSTSS